MRAVKANKEYTIDDTQQKLYQDSGFDILDESGTIVGYGRGKTVPYEEHMKAVKEIERLQSLVAERNTETEILKAEIAELKTVKTDKKAENKKAGE